MALTTGERGRSPYTDLHVKPYAKRHVKVYADTASYTSPTIDDPCLSQGGLDQNIYAAGA